MPKSTKPRYAFIVYDGNKQKLGTYQGTAARSAVLKAVRVHGESSDRVFYVRKTHETRAKKYTGRVVSIAPRSVVRGGVRFTVSHQAIVQYQKGQSIDIGYGGKVTNGPAKPKGKSKSKPKKPTRKSTRKTVRKTAAKRKPRKSAVGAARKARKARKPRK